MPEFDRFYNDFDNECKIISSKIRGEHPHKLYHYTNNKGLDGIIKSKKMRFTDYRYFNDPTEIAYGKGIIKEILNEVDITQIYPGIFKENIDLVFNAFDEYYKIYVACFSKTIDKLNLWRYYANNGCGFAIEFNEKFININNSPDINVGQPIISKVTYNKEKAKSEIAEYIRKYKEILDYAKRDINEANTSKFDSFLYDFDKILISYLILQLPFLKDESFSDEDEVRIIHLEGKGIIQLDTREPFYFDNAVRSQIPTGNNQCPFANITYDNKPIILPKEFSVEDINKIWVGPCCKFVEASTAIKDILSANGFNVDMIKIEQMKLPYRNI